MNIRIFALNKFLMTSDERRTLFADIVLPIPVKGTFTYRVPFELNTQIAVGQRAMVQFGKTKVMSGIVMRLHETPPPVVPKYIMELLDYKPIVLPLQFDFWNWMSDYYMSHLGEVMQAALPSALKLSSESTVVLSENYKLDAEILTDFEYLLVEALQIQPKLTINEVSKIVGFKKVMPLIKTMIEKKIVVMEEELSEKYKDKFERFVKLTTEYQEDEILHALMDKLSKRAYKQLELLLAFFALAGSDFAKAEISANELIKKANASQAILNVLIKNNVFEVYNKKVSRLTSYKSIASVADIKLTETQQAAFDSIKQQLETKQQVLLHGVTSSGKTEIYIKLIQETIDRGKQVLYLLPEIALTTHIINRLKYYFGNKIGVYHSRYNAFERVETWQQVLNFDASRFTDRQIIVGSRSSVFLPFSNLGLIIVDEEHDSSYKQFDPAPRYHARDSAIILANIHNAKVLLGSATPSYESYFNALTGKYGLVTLSKRYGDVLMPDIEIVDLRNQVRRKMMQSHFSRPLIEQIKTTIEEKNQVILFQNRRGFSLHLECEQCNWIPQCKHCDVSMIYHKQQNMMRCHYCGYTTTVPTACPECHSSNIRMHGFGTEKVEEELKLIFPEVAIARLDLDTTRTKNGFHQILEDFEDQKTAVLVGTQMVTKGLDFDNVKLVGILNADNMLSFPDFRAFERSFQLMAQVSGRAGRKGKQGKVLIQTFQPNHLVLTEILQNQFVKLFEQQMVMRKKIHYPPFYRLIVIRLKHRDANVLNQVANHFASQLKPLFGQNLLGPEYPLVSRIKNLYIKQMLLKFERKYNPKQIKERVQQEIDLFKKQLDHKSVIIQIDVDPQ
ncbi:MAG: primosomal protein N' [Lentimicrobiaceae bacterium]|jgi:primosomal protein N' (replication factor Y)|nr:primosomal protein N' [Lentimicrobiaceae bacterium]